MNRKSQTATAKSSSNALAGPEPLIQNTGSALQRLGDEIQQLRNTIDALGGALAPFLSDLNDRVAQSAAPLSSPTASQFVTDICGAAQEVAGLQAQIRDMLERVG